MRANANAGSIPDGWRRAPRLTPETEREDDDKASYRFFESVDDAALWLVRHGHRYECCTQVGHCGPVVTNFWGLPSSPYGGLMTLVATYDATYRELAIWNTNAVVRDPAERYEQMVDELIAGIS